MSDRCPNCSKPVLDTDVICWHCGYQLPKRGSARPAKEKATMAGIPAREQAAKPVDYDWRALAIYGLLTVAIVFGLWLVMRSLSRQPLLVRSAGMDFGGDWVTVTDANLRYTLTFPTEWQWLDLAYRDQTDLLRQLMERQGYIERALRPLGDVAGDIEIVAVAIDTRLLEDTEPKPFVLIGQSERMRGLDPQAALDLLDRQTWQVSEAAIDSHLAGQTQARFNILDSASSYQCRHLFVAGENKPGYQVAACAPQSRFGIMQHDLNDILDSFQLLEY